MCNLSSKLDCKSALAAGTGRYLADCRAIAAAIKDLQDYINGHPVPADEPHCPPASMWPVQDPSKLHTVVAGPEVQHCHPPSGS